MKDNLWRFTDNLGSFESKTAAGIKSLYFPLANEKLMSSVSPDLHGDIKTGQNSFLLPPVSRIDLTTSKASRNFWAYPVRDKTSKMSDGRLRRPVSNGVYINANKIWSAAGVSKNLKQIQDDRFLLEAGLLWHRLIRENKEFGLKSEILSFVPATGEPVEIMQVKITNVSSQPIEFIPMAAIPIYARSANSLRDHRHVTSLLQRVSLHKFGVIVKPTLLFDEAGHYPNKDNYFVLGWDEKFNAPQYLYSTQEMFCGDEGDLEAPASVLKNTLPTKEQIQGKETMGALRFAPIVLRPGQSHSYIVLMGIVESASEIKKIISKFNNIDKVGDSLETTKNFWVSKSQQINLATGDSDFDNWFRWVSIQPALRNIFGCSFLPDFDYGKGGRGWRDLWQDCLSLILTNPKEARNLLINNFFGVRIDGSNATIIAKLPGGFTPLETRRQRRQTVASGNLSLTGFIADRNDIARVWMDHGIWPLLTLDLYINETQDLDILFEEATYFCDQHIFRSRSCDRDWNPSQSNVLLSASGKVYRGSIIEHLLVENLVQFFNVGSHNHVRLEGADWNDGLDMAREKGESVAFSAMYASNLKLLCELLLKTGKRKIKVAEELKILLKEVNYNDVKRKQKVLNDYFTKTKAALLGRKASIDVMSLANNLEKKSLWMANHIRKHEWLKLGFFNGYYDNKGERVEGARNKLVRMILSSQVFPIMSGIAESRQIARILKSVEKYLFDTKLKGFHLNTDFKEEQHQLGRAFSFIYGDKENGAFFNHIIVMFAYALYKQGYIEEGWRVLSSIYNMAVDTEKSKIYPCLPEYFNLEGRGMYSYLTGSASWFVLTLLTQVFGIRGQGGDLVIEPKISRDLFKNTTTITISRIFTGRKIKISFSNRKRLQPNRYKIVKASLNAKDLPLKDSRCVLISRRTILSLPQDKINTLHITLS